MVAVRVKQAVLMVGGLGTRLLPLTQNRPKPILPVADKPCIWYLAKSMAEAGIEEIILACGYKPGEMEALGKGDDLGVSIEYAYEKEPMGTGGALKLLEDRLDDTFAASNGDVFADFDMGAQIRAHLASDSEITISLAYVEDPSQYGIALLDDDSRVLRFMERPKPEETYSHWINSGVYVAERKVLEDVPEGQFYDFSKELFPKLISQGRTIRGVPMSGIWMDVGRPHDLLEASLWVSRNRGTARHDEGELLNGSFAPAGSSIEGSRLDESVVSRGCIVKGSDMKRAMLLEGCEVDGATISGSILGRGCRVGRGAVITGSVLADYTVVEPGTRVEGDREVRFARPSRAPCRNPTSRRASPSRGGCPCTARTRRGSRR
jgi:mannose-1-phosphate guanylyltransferase